MACIFWRVSVQQPQFYLACDFSCQSVHDLNTFVRRFHFDLPRVSKSTFLCGAPCKSVVTTEFGALSRLSRQLAALPLLFSNLLCPSIHSSGTFRRSQSLFEPHHSTHSCSWCFQNNAIQNLSALQRTFLHRARISPQAKVTDALAKLCSPAVPGHGG